MHHVLATWAADKKCDPNYMCYLTICFAICHSFFHLILPFDEPIASTAVYGIVPERTGGNAL